MEAPQDTETDQTPFVVPADEVTKSNPLLNVLKDPTKAKKLPPAAKPTGEEAT